MPQVEPLVLLEQVLQEHGGWRTRRPAGEPLDPLHLIAESDRRVLAARVVSLLADLKEDYKDAESAVAFHLIPQLDTLKAWEVYLLLLVPDLPSDEDLVRENADLGELLHQISYNTRYCRKLVIGPGRTQEAMQDALEPFLPLRPPVTAAQTAVQDALRKALARTGEIAEDQAETILASALQLSEDEALAKIQLTLEEAAGGAR